MKLSLTIILVFNLCLLCAQENQALCITTSCNKKVWISSNHLNALDQRSIDSVIIRNHTGQYKSTLRKVKGVLLKDVLKDISFEENSPKELSNYYIVCTARDDYKVVFSWNELFNTNVGDDLIVVLNIQVASGGNQAESLALLSPMDKVTGRRYVKELTNITILRVK